MRTRWVGCWASCISGAVALYLTTAPQHLLAQASVAVDRTPNAIAGRVTDASQAPIPNAEVFVEQLRQRVRTTADGKFLFTGVKAGKYTVGVRTIGYLEKSTRIAVNESGAVVTFELARAPFSLPSVVTVARRGGLSGVIADTGYKAMANVTVRVIGEPLSERTDSAGAFFLPLKPGRYMVRLDREGYARQLIGVTVPENEGRQLAAWMVPQSGRDNPREGANLFDMQVRLARKTPVNSQYFTREDIEKRGARDLQTLANTTENRKIDPSCPVLIDGGPQTVPLWRMTTEELEYVEIYLPLPARQTAGPATGSRDKFSAARLDMAPSKRGACEDLIIAWLRRL